MIINSTSFITAILILIALPLNAADQDPIITQGSSIITQLEFDGRISRIPAKDRLPFLSDGSRVEKILRQLIMDRRFADAARKVGFEKDKLVQQRLKLAMESELADAWLDSIQAKKINAANFELMAKEYYLTHKNDFKTVETIDIAHLLVGTENKTNEEAKTLSNELYTKLKSDPGLWDQFVLKYSDDAASKGNAGKFIAVKRGKMVKPFEDAAFSLKTPGEMSTPILTQYGFHIIRLDVIKPIAKISFDEVKARLIAEQRSMFTKRVRTEYISAINTAEELVIPDCAIEEMMVRYFEDEGVVASYQKCIDAKSSK